MNRLLNSRLQDFKKISKVLNDSARFSGRRSILAEGDSLKLIRQLPESCISLILTDPPYHSTKKSNIYGDKAFEEDQHYLEWMAEYAQEWRRVLRPNGSLFCFCASPMEGYLTTIFARNFNVLSNIVWTKPNDPGFDGWKQKMKKEALRQWYPHSERIIFAEPAAEGNLHRSAFANFIRDARKRTGMSAHELAERIGAYGAVNHGGAVSNWETGRNIPSREQYSKICSAFKETGKIVSMPVYEDVIRPFIMDASKEFTDIWNFPSVRPYKGKHPAEKPISMLEHAIEATTYEGDIVLDCFSGSGSTALAALKLNRFAVAMEIDPNWSAQLSEKLKYCDSGKEYKFESKDMAKPDTSKSQKEPQLFLFTRTK